MLLSKINWTSLYKFQDEILLLLRDELSPFYLTGGTALSRYYLSHRYSEDLDFFCHDQEDFEPSISQIARTLSRSKLLKEHGMQISETYARLPTSNGSHNMKDFEIEEIILYPVIEMTGIYSEEFVFQKGHVYTVAQDAIFEAPVSVEGGAEIRISHDVELRFLSSVVSSNNGLYAKFLKNKSLDQDQRRWDGIKLYSHENDINNWIVKDVKTGIHVFGENTSIQNTIFERNGVAVQTLAMDTNVTNCIFIDIDDRGFGLNQSAGSETIEHVLHKNIFHNTYCGLRTNGNAVSIMHNYFVDCAEGIVSSNGFHVIERNCFDRNDKGIICNGSHVDIKDNNFYNNTNSISLETAYYVGRSNPRIKNNNFYQSSGYAIKLGAWSAKNNIDATLNYWHSNEIDKLIYDNHDLPALEYEVLYLPKLNRVIVGVGV
jgi:hypothetical protein